MTSLKCGQCGHENDLTRVFCQNCGSRLERAEGAAGPTIAGPTQVPTDRPAAIKRKKAISGSKGGGAVGFLVKFLLTVAMAAVLALLIQMGREPEGMPEAKTANEAKAGQLYQGLKAFSESTFPRATEVKQDQVNNYLACRLVSGVSESDGPSARAKFVRAFVIIETGKLRFFVEQQFLGRSMFLYTEYEPEMDGKLVSLKETGGGIGHVRFTPNALPLLDRLMGPVAKSAVDVSDVVKTLNGLDLKRDDPNKPGVAILRWSGSKPAAP